MTTQTLAPVLHRDTKRDTYTAPCGDVWHRIYCTCGYWIAQREPMQAEALFLTHLTVCGRRRDGHVVAPHGCGCGPCFETFEGESAYEAARELYLPDVEPPVMS